jgi:2'-5' RNA ligase
MPRLFVAVDLSEKVTEVLASLQDREIDARWVNPAQIHLTVRFLGDVESSRVEPLTHALADIDAHSFELSPQGLGVFPSRRSPRVLWVDLKENEKLFDLQQKVESTVVDLGFDPEDRSYIPHLTIARCRDTPPKAIHRFMREHGNFSAEPFHCHQFHLYESELNSDGARYTKQASFDLIRSS